VRAVARDAWPTGGPRRNRLFAFGFDAFRLSSALRAGGTNVNVDGLTGRLTLDADRRVHRELAWAQLHNGQTRPLAVASAGGPQQQAAP
jgi:outer membrane PBP1 activator LpoA protein